MQSIHWGLAFILCVISTGYAHPPHVGVGRLIIGKLVRLRRTAAETKVVKETEVATTGSKDASDDLVISPKVLLGFNNTHRCFGIKLDKLGGSKNTKLKLYQKVYLNEVDETTSKDKLSQDKETSSKPDLDGKILLLMIVPPDKVKEGKDGKEGNLKRKPNKKKNKRKILSNIVTKPRASKCKCASELAKQLDIDTELATQLLTNSSMGLIAAVACTKNACPLMTKISEVLNSKIKYVSDVRPVITCEDVTTTTTTSCGTQKEKEKECGGDKEPKDSKSDKNPKNTGAFLVTSGDAELISLKRNIMKYNGIGPSCDEVVQTVAQADQGTVIIENPPLAGTWVSDRCETRPGPEYILRWHWYSDNGTYSHNTFFYLDDGCARPLWSRCVKGTYAHRGKSWLMAGSDQLEIFLQEVMIILYSTTMALDMFNKANASCPGVVMGRWTPDVQYVVYKHVEKNASTATKDELEKEQICMDFLQLSVKEMTLMRIQLRPAVSYDVWGQREELLLGEPRSKFTLFYDPLVRANQTLDCVPCQQVHKSTLLYPPKLKHKPLFPIHLSGEWISTRCEIRQNSLFLRRRLRVSGQSWHAEYWFFTDPLCSTPSLLAAAEGVYVATEETEVRVQGAKDFDFEVQRAFLTVFDKGLAENLQDDGKCGPKGAWQVAVTRDLTPSGGCPALGITLPTTEFELVRIEGDGAGNILLFLGQTEDRTGPVKKRPTYFQPPMIQCSTAEFPLTHFLNSYNKAGIPRLRTTILLVVFYSVFIFVV